MEQSCRKLYIAVLMKMYFTQLLQVALTLGFSSSVYMEHVLMYRAEM